MYAQKTCTKQPGCAHCDYALFIRDVLKRWKSKIPPKISAQAANVKNHPKMPERGSPPSVEYTRGWLNRLQHFQYLPHFFLCGWRSQWLGETIKIVNLFWCRVHRDPEGGHRVHCLVAIPRAAQYCFAQSCLSRKMTGYVTAGLWRRISPTFRRCREYPPVGKLPWVDWRWAPPRLWVFHQQFWIPAPPQEGTKTKPMPAISLPRLSVRWMCSLKLIWKTGQELPCPMPI